MSTKISYDGFRVLAIGFVYNEINFLPLSIEYYKKNNCDIYIIDNMSTDGTYEWLLENNIPCHRFDTNNEFHLPNLQKELIRTVHEIKPHWFLWLSPDLFQMPDLNKDIKQYLYDIHINSAYNIISIPHILFMRPVDRDDEIFEYPYINKFKYYDKQIFLGQLSLIAKYSNNLSAHADSLKNKHNKIHQERSGINIEFGMCKPIQIQEEKLKRRTKSWTNGVPKAFGQHYVKNNSKGWKFSINEVYDITDLSIEHIDNVKHLKYLKTLLDTLNIDYGPIYTDILSNKLSDKYTGNNDINTQVQSITHRTKIDKYGNKINSINNNITRPANNHITTKITDVENNIVNPQKYIDYEIVYKTKLDSYGNLKRIATKVYTSNNKYTINSNVCDTSKLYCYISDSVRTFKNDFLNKFNFLDINKYTNTQINDTNIIIFGLYTQKDFNFLEKQYNNTNNKIIIMWGGSDAKNYIHKNVYNKILFDTARVLNIAISTFIQQTLLKNNINSIYIQLNQSNLDSNVYKNIDRTNSDAVYVYVADKDNLNNNMNIYGENIILELQKKLKLNLIIADHTTYNKQEIFEAYKKSFIGLRLTSHDGCPNTVIEMNSLGRKCIYNGDLPNSIKWTNVDDIIESIMHEYNQRHIDYTYISENINNLIFNNTKLFSQIVKYSGSFDILLNKLNNTDITNLYKDNDEVELESDDILISIITHKRPTYCLNILKQIVQQYNKYSLNRKIYVNVYHDRCTSDYSEIKNFCVLNSNDKLQFNYNITDHHLGKWKFYEMQNLIFADISKYNFKYYIALPDDIELSNNFLLNITNILKPKFNLLCVNFFTVEKHITHANVKYKAIIYDNIKYLNSNWVDGCFITYKKYVANKILSEPENSKIKNSNRGSGVALELIKMFNAQDISIYQTYYSYIKHLGATNSVMHNTTYQNSNIHYAHIEDENLFSIEN